MEVGFVGLGKMGSGMVRSLLRAGNRVTVWNRTPSKAEPLREHGARIADELRDACSGDAVFTMLADDAAVNAVVCREHQLLDLLAPAKTVHVSSSTISPTLVHELAERHRERNQLFVSAPMLGRPEVAEDGKLVALAAGNAATIESVQPLLDAMAHKTFVLGNAPEAANLAKLSCNTLVATIVEALAETIALVAKSNLIQPDRFLDMLLGTVLASPIFQPYGEHLRDHEFKPGFRMPLALKDMELALGAAHDYSAPLPIVSMIRDHMLEAIAAGFGECDWIALALVAQRAAGLRAVAA
jgi:3-hydroxyisobutyrate dehydrogenase-like beta-hydroxyacid dehydrogenase